MNFLIFILIAITLIYRYGYDQTPLSAQILDTGLIGELIAIALYNVIFRPLFAQADNWTAQIILGILLLLMPVLIGAAVLWLFLSAYPIPPG
jgi:hypothetical protein